MEMQKHRSDFSADAINKNVLKSTIEHPTVLIPTAIGGLGLAALALIEPSVIFMVIAGVGSLLGALSWGANFSLRRDFFAKRYIERVAKQVEEMRIEKTQALQALLGDVQSEQGMTQFARSQEKFQAFEQMLNKKLNPTELTYSRFMGMAEQVYLSILDNLTDVANIMQSLKAIDAGYVYDRLKEVEGQSMDEHAHQEQGALKKRLELRESQEDKVRQLLAQNEEAMTQMDLTIASVAAMRTDGQQASMDMESAMAELGRLASRAKNYES